MSDVKALEHAKKNAQGLIERRDLALKLYDNHEFRKLIVESYFTEEAARLVQLSADPALDANQRADALAMAQATGHLKRYLSMMIQMGNVAAREMPEVDAQLEEARIEEEEQGAE